MQIEQVVDNIHRLEVVVPQTNTAFVVYLIREAPGVLLEPGPTVTVPYIQEAMQQLGMAELAYIIPTHIHMDHAGALGTLAQLFPKARVVLHPLGVKHVVNPARLIESTKMAFGESFETVYGPIFPVPESQVKVAEDMEIIGTNCRQLQIIYTPGHAPHHVSIMDMASEALFCGESLGMPLPGAESSPVPVAAPPSFDIDVYLQSMQKLRQLRPRLLLYSHDGIGRNPDELITRAGENTRLLANLILEALRHGDNASALNQRVIEHVRRQMGAEVKGWDMAMVIAGFALYFKKKGLV